MDRITEGTTVRGRDGKLSVPGAADAIETAGEGAPAVGARPTQAPGSHKPAGASAEAGEEK